jgi:hypothetical protein
MFLTSPLVGGSTVDAVQRLVIENECRKLSLLYCRHLDHLDPSAFADLYAEDAVYKPAAVAEPIRGRSAIFDWISHYPRDRLGRHISTNQMVEVTDDSRATGTSYAVVFREPDPEIGRISTRVTPRSVVEYEDTYRRTEQGWLFASRRYRFQFLQC